MKLSFRLLCMVSLLLVSLLPVAHAAEESSTFRLRLSSTAVKMGEYVTVTVAGEGLNDVYGAEIGLAYDPARLAYTGYTSGLSGETFVLTPKVDQESGIMLLVFTCTGQRPGISGDSDLFTITFRAAETGAASIGLQTLALLDSQTQELTGVKGQSVSVDIASPGTDPGNGDDDDSDPGSDNDQDSGEESADSSDADSDVIIVEAVLGDDGVAVADILPEQLLGAARLSADQILRIQIRTAPEARELRVNLPAAEVVQSAVVANIKTLKIESELAGVSIDTDLLKESQVTASSILQLIIGRADAAQLSSEIRQKLGSSAVYDFTLSLDGQGLGNLDGKVKVELPYELAAGQNPSQVVIYYIPEDDTLQLVKNGRYYDATKKAQFRPAHFSRYAAVYAQVSFRDMEGYGWAGEGVYGLAAREVVQGRSEGYYVPEGDVTRAEFVQMLVRLFDLEDAAATAGFKDVEAGAWYCTAIASAQKAGLVEGREDGSFGVNDRISREDMAVLIHRVSKIRGVTVPEAAGGAAGFADQEEISAYAKEAVAALQKSGLINGVREGYFQPKDSSTRAQAATVLYWLYQAIAD